MNSRHFKIYATLAVVYVVGEIVLALAPVRPYRTDSEVLSDFQIERQDSAGKGEILLFGDSSLGNGVDEKRLSEVLGRKCRNLALVGSFGLRSDELMLRRLAKRGPRPEAIVVMHAPNVWIKRTGEAADALERRIGAPTLENMSQRLFGLLPSVRRSRSYKELLFSRARGLDPEWERYQSKADRDVELAAELPGVGYVPQGHTPDWSKRRAGMFAFAPDDGAKERVRNLSRLARATGARVYLAASPLWDARAAASGEAIAGFEAWFAGLAAEDADCELLYDHVPQVPGEFLGDAFNHLNAKGGEQFTEWVAAHLAARLHSRESPGAIEWPSTGE